MMTSGSRIGFFFFSVVQNRLKQFLLWSLWKPKQWQDSVEMWLMMHRKKIKYPSEWQWIDLHGNYIKIIESRKVLHVHMW